MTSDEYWEKYRDIITPSLLTVQELRKGLDENERTEQTKQILEEVKRSYQPTDIGPTEIQVNHND